MALTAMDGRGGRGRHIRRRCRRERAAATPGTSTTATDGTQQLPSCPPPSGARNRRRHRNVTGRRSRRSTSRGECRSVSDSPGGGQPARRRGTSRGSRRRTPRRRQCGSNGEYCFGHLPALPDGAAHAINQSSLTHRSASHEVALPRPGTTDRGRGLGRWAVGRPAPPALAYPGAGRTHTHL